MKNLPISYVHVKELNKALGKQIAAFGSRALFESFLAGICDPLTASLDQPFVIDSGVAARLFSSLENKVAAELKSTQRIEMIARAFDWSGDAFMHKLKTDFVEREERAWECVRAIYARYYGDMSAFVEALKMKKGLVVCASPNGSGKSTFLVLTDILIRGRFRDVDRKIHSDNSLIASSAPGRIESKFSQAYIQMNIHSELMSVDWPARSGDGQLMTYFDPIFEDQIKEVFEESRSRLVIATTHASSVQGALHRFQYASGGSFVAKRFLACAAVQLVYRDSDTKTGRKHAEMEVVRFQTPNQVNAVMEKGVSSGLYARTFGDKPSREEKAALFASAAIALGWKFSPAHDGYINERHRNRNGEDPSSYASYEVAADPEEACFWDGIETMEDATKMMIGKIETKPYGHEPEEMDRVAFVELAEKIVSERGSPFGGGLQYEDDYITIRTNYNGLKLEISRKPFIDPEHPDLRVPNPMTMVDRNGDIIRHHGEHIYITGHMKSLNEPKNSPSF